jgi:hypothetical protein
MYYRHANIFHLDFLLHRLHQPGKQNAQGYHGRKHH